MLTLRSALAAIRDNKTGINKTLYLWIVGVVFVLLFTAIQARSASEAPVFEHSAASAASQAAFYLVMTFVTLAVAGLLSARSGMAPDRRREQIVIGTGSLFTLPIEVQLMGWHEAALATGVWYVLAGILLGEALYYVVRLLL